MTPIEFKQWRGDRTQTQAGQILNLSRRQITDYENGTATIGKNVQRLCRVDTILALYSLQQLTQLEAIDNIIEAVTS